MLGYLLVGVAIGPHALHWIPDEQGIRLAYLAEFGVVFLMFSHRPGILPAASCSPCTASCSASAWRRCCCTAVRVDRRSRWLLPACPGRPAFALGGALAMSSTAIVSKLLAERLRTGIRARPRDDRRAAVPGSGRGAAADPDPGAGAAGASIWRRRWRWRWLKAAVVLLLMLFSGQKLMRGWFHIVARRTLARAVHAQRAADHAGPRLAHRTGRPVAGAGRLSSPAC